MAIAYENQNNHHTYICPRTLVGNFMLSRGYYGHWAIMKTTKTGFEWPVVKDNDFEDCHWQDLVYASLSGQPTAYFWSPDDMPKAPHPWWACDPEHCYGNWYIGRPWHDDPNNPSSPWEEDLGANYTAAETPPNPTHPNAPQSARIKTKNGNFIVANFNGSEFLFHWADGRLNPQKDADASDWLFALTWGQPIQRGKLPKNK